MEKRRRWTSTTAALAVLSLLGTAQAQTSQRKEAHFDKVWGADFLNGYLHGDAYAKLEDSPYTATDGSAQNIYELGGGAHADGGLTILFRRLEAFRFEADASMQDDTGRQGTVGVTTHGFMRIAGRTLLSFDRGWPLQDHQAFGPYSLLSGGVNWGIGIGIFSVSVHAEAAGALEGKAQLGVNRGEQGGSASIGFRARQYASLVANVHFWPIEAGVESALDLPVAAAQARLRTDLQDGLRGELTYAVDPISLVARAFGCINLFFTRPCASLTFLSWSSPAQRGSLQLN